MNDRHLTAGATALGREDPFSFGATVVAWI